MDKAGNLYGVTSGGGAHGNGALYELSKSGTFRVLHSFAGSTSDGCAPSGSVARDKAGTFYGTTEYCGSSKAGTIWEVSKTGKETILHNFAGGTGRLQSGRWCDSRPEGQSVWGHLWVRR
jgi:uncharacterized repeat protein (TIGR03803 family)